MERILLSYQTLKNDSQNQLPIASNTNRHSGGNLVHAYRFIESGKDLKEIL